MENQYSVEFFQKFVENLQELCMSHLNFDKFVEVTGYISVEMDNARKERYVVSEMLPNGGQAVSESYCIKAFRTGLAGNRGNIAKSLKRPMNVQVTREPKRQQRSKESFDGGDEYYSSSQGDDTFRKHVAEVDEGLEESGTVSVPGPSEMRTLRSSRVSEDNYVKIPPSMDRKAGNTFDSKHGSTLLEARSTLHEEKEVVVNLPNSWSSSPDVKPEPASSVTTDDDDVIDLDLYDDDLDDSQCVSPQFEEVYPFNGKSSIATFPSADRNQATTSHDQLQINPYIEKVTKFSLKKLTEFYSDNGGKEEDFYLIPPERLDTILSNFFRGMRKKDGSPYDPATLRTMQCHIDKYLKNAGYSWSILRDVQFKGSRDILKSLLGDRVKVKLQKKHNPVTEKDIEILFNTEQLGLFNAESLINTMWFMNSCVFGIKSLSHHFNLKWGDLILQVDEDGQEYLQRNFNGSMARGPKLYAKPTNTSRCFVYMFKKYAGARPSECNEASSSFYLNMTRNMAYTSWYMPENLNWHKLSFLWKRMLTAGGLSRDKKPMLDIVGTTWTNHN